jgi:hypothetical protein
LSLPSRAASRSIGYDLRDRGSIVKLSAALPSVSSWRSSGSGCGGGWSWTTFGEA